MAEVSTAPIGVADCHVAHSAEFPKERFTLMFGESTKLFGQPLWSANIHERPGQPDLERLAIAVDVLSRNGDVPSVRVPMANDLGGALI